MKHLILPSLMLALAACTTTPISDDFTCSPGTAWVAFDDGWDQEAEAVYLQATGFVMDYNARYPDHAFAVVLDLDETVMNNVEYQLRRERLGLGYTSESWYEWTQEEDASLVPGVEAFLDTVNQNGGHVAFVTNRSDREQLATENNLADLGLVRGDDFQILLTRARPNGVSAKDDRYALIPALLAAQGYPDVQVIAYLGDNVGDKPATEGEWAFFCIDQGAMYGDPCAETPGPGQ